MIIEDLVILEEFYVADNLKYCLVNHTSQKGNTFKACVMVHNELCAYIGFSDIYYRLKHMYK